MDIPYLRSASWFQAVPHEKVLGNSPTKSLWIRGHDRSFCSRRWSTIASFGRSSPKIRFLDIPQSFRRSSVTYNYPFFHFRVPVLPAWTTPATSCDHTSPERVLLPFFLNPAVSVRDAESLAWYARPPRLFRYALLLTTRLGSQAQTNTCIDFSVFLHVPAVINSLSSHLQPVPSPCPIASWSHLQAQSPFAWHQYRLSSPCLAAPASHTAHTHCHKLASAADQTWSY